MAWVRAEVASSPRAKKHSSSNRCCWAIVAAVHTGALPWALMWDVSNQERGLGGVHMPARHRRAGAVQVPMGPCKMRCARMQAMSHWGLVGLAALPSPFIQVMQLVATMRQRSMSNVPCRSRAPPPPGLNFSALALRLPSRSTSKQFQSCEHSAILQTSVSKRWWPWPEVHYEKTAAAWREPHAPAEAKPPGLQGALCTSSTRVSE